MGVRAAMDIDPFISLLYRSGTSVETPRFREWAMRQLRQVLPFDAGFWGTGLLETGQFHTATLIDLPPRYTAALEATRETNPLLGPLLAELGTPKAMEDVVPDAEFYKSDLYRDFFKRFGIERMLSTMHVDERSGILSLLSVYRFDRKNKFSKADHETQRRAVHHLVNAASQAYFSRLFLPQNYKPADVAAMCDSHGYFHEVQPPFLDLLADHFPDWRGRRLPFGVPKKKADFCLKGLHVYSEPVGQLHCLRIREKQALDELTEREREVVLGVCRGLSFKAVAKEIGLAPSTVSSHLYRIYDKLGVKSRTALAKLVYRMPQYDRREQTRRHRAN